MSNQVTEERILAPLRIFQAIHNDLNLKHEIVTLEDGTKRWAYTYEGTDPYELPDSAFPTILSKLQEREKASWKAGYDAGGRSTAKILLDHQVTMHAGKRGQYKPVQVVLVRDIKQLAELSHKGQG